MKDVLTLLFLLLAYNFLLGYSTFEKILPIPLFPTDVYNFVIVTSFNLALFLGWLFGQRRSTVLWLSYLLFSQIIMLSLLKRDISIIYMDLPSITLSLMLIWLFESPVERNIRKITEERNRLRKELEANREELKRLREESKLRQELMDLLKKEKADIENQLEKLLLKHDIFPPDSEEVFDSILYKRGRLEEQKEELERKIKELEDMLETYKEREERLKRANARLFRMLGEIREDSGNDNFKKEIAQLRKTRKKLSKTVRELNSKLSLLEEENRRLKNRIKDLESENKSLRKKVLEFESAGNSESKNKVEMYKEVLTSLFKNIEFSERAIRELANLDPSRKSSFIREILLLDYKEDKEDMEMLKGAKGVFKLKPQGGRIYVTYGEKKRWLILGMLDSEDDKDKDRYIRELLSKS